MYDQSIPAEFVICQLYLIHRLRVYPLKFPNSILIPALSPTHL
jgi:hypothetical protein